MSLTRRAATKLLTGGAAMAAMPVMAAPNTKGRIRLAVSTYSYWHFRTAKYPIEKVIDHAYDLGFDGVELLHRQFESEDLSYLNKLRQQAFRRVVAGLPPLAAGTRDDRFPWYPPQRLGRWRELRWLWHDVIVASFRRRTG